MPTLGRYVINRPKGPTSIERLSGGLQHVLGAKAQRQAQQQAKQQELMQAIMLAQIKAQMARQDPEEIIKKRARRASLARDLYEMGRTEEAKSLIGATEQESQMPIMEINEKVSPAFTLKQPDKLQVEDGKDRLIPEDFEFKFGQYRPKKAFSPRAIKEKRKAETIGTTNIKREIFSKDLSNFLLLDEQIPRGEGLHRIKRGLSTRVQAFAQDTPVGKAAAAHDAAKKRLRVQLVRAAGDVGNINIVEQKAAEKMIPGIYDSVGTTNLKRAYLKELGKAIDDESENEIKAVINNFMNTNEYKDETLQEEFDRMQQIIMGD